MSLFITDLQVKIMLCSMCRHCLWILGNGPTLENSGTIWARLVSNAKARGCFYNAEDDKNLAQAIATSLVEHGQFHLLQNMDSLLFREARWKVCYFTTLMHLFLSSSLESKPKTEGTIISLLLPHQ